METYITLSIEQIKQLKDRGYSWIMLSNGKRKKITMKDVIVNKVAADRLVINHYESKYGKLTEDEKKELKKLLDRNNFL